MPLHLHSNFRDTRPVFHFDAYKAEKSYYFLEVSYWTLEIDTRKSTSKPVAWYMPTRAAFWGLMALSTAARAFDIVDTPMEHIGLTAAWVGYVLVITNA